MKYRPKLKLTDATKKAIGSQFETHKQGMVYSPEFILIAQPVAKRGYLLLRRTVNPQPNN